MNNIKVTLLTVFILIGASFSLDIDTIKTNQFINEEEQDLFFMLRSFISTSLFNNVDTHTYIMSHKAIAINPRKNIYEFGPQPFIIVNLDDHGYIEEIVFNNVKVVSNNPYSNQLKLFKKLKHIRIITCDLDEMVKILNTMDGYYSNIKSIVIKSLDETLNINQSYYRIKDILEENNFYEENSITRLSTLIFINKNI